MHGDERAAAIPMTVAGLFVARGARLWILARLLVAVVLALGALSGGRQAAVTPAGLVLLAPPAAFLVVALAAALGVLDVGRRGERALLGNFGVSPRRLVLWLAAPAVAGELLVGLAMALALAR